MYIEVGRQWCSVPKLASDCKTEQDADNLQPPHRLGEGYATSRG